MLVAVLWIDHQHTTTGVALGLGGEEGGGQFQLVGARLRVVLGIQRHEHLCPGESSRDSRRDPLKVPDRRLIKENRERAQVLGTQTLNDGPCHIDHRMPIAKENVISIHPETIEQWVHQGKPYHRTATAKTIFPATVPASAPKTWPALVRADKSKGSEALAKLRRYDARGSA